MDQSESTNSKEVAMHKSGLMTLDDYNKVVQHINEVDSIINKYNYLSDRCVSDWHSIKCKITDIKQQLYCAEHER